MTERKGRTARIRRTESFSGIKVPEFCQKCQSNESQKRGFISYVLSFFKFPPWSDLNALNSNFSGPTVCWESIGFLSGQRVSSRHRRDHVWGARWRLFCPSERRFLSFRSFVTEDRRADGPGVASGRIRSREIQPGPATEFLVAGRDYNSRRALANMVARQR